MHIAGGVLQDQLCDLTRTVQGVVAHHIGGHVQPRQTLGIDPYAGALIGVQDLHAVCEGITAQFGGVGGHLAGELAGLAQPLEGHGAVLTADDHLDQVAQLEVVGGPLIAVCAAVGGQDGHSVSGVGGVGPGAGVGAAAQVSDDADLAAVLRGGGGGHGGPAAVPAQQQGDGVPHLIAAQVGQLVGGGGCLDLIGLACHLHGCGVGGSGAQFLDRAGHPVGVHPQGLHGLTPVDDVVVLDGLGGGGGAVPVHPGAVHIEGDGLLPAAGRHHRALHHAVDQGHPVHLTGGVE